jgi:glycosyltransferase involved in cell wall biosynthesis
VFCLPSHYEGFGLPVVEAMGRGVPVVVTTGSALEEVAADAGAYFAPGDAEACARELDLVLGDDDRRARMQRAGVARAAELTWDACAEGHVRVYSRALARPSS